MTDGQDPMSMNEDVSQSSHTAQILRFSPSLAAFGLSTVRYPGPRTEETICFISYFANVHFIELLTF